MDFEARLDPELLPIYRARALRPAPQSVAEARRDMRALMQAAAGAIVRDPLIRREAVEIPGPSGAPPLRALVYRSPTAPARAPAMLWIHGGGFTMGEPEQDEMLCERMAREAHCVVVAPDYRLAPEHGFPAAPDDCFAALAWMQSGAGRLELDGDRLAVGGASAGGNLAAAVALMARDRGVKLRLQLLDAPCLDDRHETASSWEAAESVVWGRARSLDAWSAYLQGGSAISVYAAPARAENLSGLAPCFMSVGELELMRDEAIEYAARLARSGTTTELHIWPGAFHGFEVMAPNAEISQAARGAMMRALRRALAA